MQGKLIEFELTLGKILLVFWLSFVESLFQIE